MKAWTQEETDTLLKYYNEVSNESLCLLLPLKSPCAIYKKAYKMGLRKASEIEFINRSIARRGNKSNLWKGGIIINAHGYRLVKMPEHHRANQRGYVLEHILVFEKECGIRVPDNCCVHHLNGIKDDNRIENLCLMNHSAHTVFHHKGARRSAETKKKISEGKRSHEL